MEALANDQEKKQGSIVSIVNAITEKADTRNWQSLPYAIHYARISLPEGTHQVDLNAKGQISTNEHFTFDIKKGETTFFSYHQLESQPVY